MFGTVDRPIRCFQSQRFQVFQEGERSYRFVDCLNRTTRVLPVELFDRVADARRDISFITHGFMNGVLSAASGPISDRGAPTEDGLFWQYPCRTEAAAWCNHAEYERPGWDGQALHVYAGLPWATWIDKENCSAWTPGQRAALIRELAHLRANISGLSETLQSFGIGLRVHTVCQHIHWGRSVETWESLGITDAWVSHLPEAPLQAMLPITVHPWSLYAVNLEDPQRSAGLVRGIPPDRRRFLASFVGAKSNTFYLSDIRDRMEVLGRHPEIHIQYTEGWHFQKVVYDHQILRNLGPEADQTQPQARTYNEILSDSVFALCPSGSGPNSLRLWEAMAAGCVPVLLGERPRLPEGGSLGSIDWDAFVLKVDAHELEALPHRLEVIRANGVEPMLAAAAKAYALVRRQTCFDPLVRDPVSFTAPPGPC